MSPRPDFRHDWHTASVVTFDGMHDTHIKSANDYPTRTLADLFTLDPVCTDKAEGPAFIPSSYCAFDARNHSVQRERGCYVALTGDIDTGNHSLRSVETAVQDFTGDAAYLIYSSPHATPDDRRWRIVIPLAEPTDFDTWHDAQNALFNFMEFDGIPTDRALARAAQPVYLPNVPEVHPKTGELLRDDTGPLFYQRATTGTKSPGLPLTVGKAARGIEVIREKRLADEALRQKIRAEAEQRRANRAQDGDGSAIEDFNASNDLAGLLAFYDYKQSPRHPEDWRSPKQTSDSYATRIIGDKWVSLSASDAAAGLGAQCAAGCYGDAFDLLVHYEHEGDSKAALRKLYADRRAAQFPPQSTPPAQADDPGWTEAPAEIAEPDYELDVVPVEVIDVETLEVFHPADWQGHAPPSRVWRWADFIPDMQATLLTGAGAAGKSLATQQMSTCIALGLPFLGIETRRAPALYITCEDDMDELHRRQTAICDLLQISLESTRDSLFLLSLQGRLGNELATFDHEGRMTVSDRFREIAATCRALNIKHVTIDNTAHTFAGNENDRHQVAAFVNLNNALAQTIGGSVVMVGHPNKAGDSYSGSTAWENQVRSRIYLEIPKGPEDGAPINPDMRVLRNEKANYARRGAEVTCYWHKGAFATEQQMPKGPDGAPVETEREEYEDVLFLDLLDRLTKQRRHISHAANLANYAPKVMASMPEARGTSAASFKRAMERLFSAETIAASQPLWNGPDRHPVHGLARK